MKKINLLTTLCILGLLVFNTGMAFGQVVKTAAKFPGIPFSDIKNGGQILDVEEEGKLTSPNNNDEVIVLHPDKKCKVRLEFYVFAANVVENWPAEEPMYLKFSALGFNQYYPVLSQDFQEITSTSEELMYANLIRIEFDMSVLCSNPKYTGNAEMSLALVSSTITDTPFPINDYSAEGEIFSCQNFDDCSVGGYSPPNDSNNSSINISRTIELECKATDCAVNNATGSTKYRSSINEYFSASSFQASLSPNPTADFSLLNYTLEIASEVSYICFDATGKKISEAKDWQNAGFHQKRWNTSSWAPGLYWIQLKVGDQVETKRLVKY